MLNFLYDKYRIIFKKRFGTTEPRQKLVVHVWQRTLKMLWFLQIRTLVVENFEDTSVSANKSTLRLGCLHNRKWGQKWIAYLDL